MMVTSQKDSYTVETAAEKTAKLTEQVSLLMLEKIMILFMMNFLKNLHTA